MNIQKLANIFKLNLWHKIKANKKFVFKTNEAF
jgi:hypothetical protein